MKLTVYSKTVCPYCVQAKTYLKNNKIEFEEINIEDAPQAREYIMKSGHRTVPQIYYNGKIFVEGGWQGLSKLSGEDIMREIELRNEISNSNITF
jgi:glutaredoxin 3